MGIEVLFLVVAGLFLPVVFMGFVVVWWRAGKDRDSLEREWRSYARARKLDLVPASGEWPNHRSPLLRWSDDAASYVIETLERPTLRTRVCAKPAVAANGKLVVRANGDIESELPRGFAAAVFTNDVRRTMLGFGTATSLRYVDGEILFEWRDAETNHARLDEARAVVRHVVSAIGAVVAQSGDGAAA